MNPNDIRKSILLCLLVVSTFLVQSCKNDPDTESQTDAESVALAEDEKYRPAFHFTPRTDWMNDPNGMFFLNGTYHLFFQHYPEDNVWGPMHWGHATSTDMIDWEEQPIAIYPDSLGYIFSGSAVVDHNNTSGFGEDGQVPVIAMYTYHDPEGEKSDAIDFQYQAIAYSLDEGKTWTKYEGNPVIANPGIRDFRDPKVVWDEEREQWVMVLAAQNKAMIYGSPNLKDWTHLSDFGENVGAHGGVWECPDFFPMPVQDSEEIKWVLLQSLNPGSANGGSGTQYFVGDFDGTNFTLDPGFEAQLTSQGPQWLDYGRDNYAGVTWSNIPDSDGRTLFMGWMSNWDYAQIVPTETWRSAMTLPRELKLKSMGDGFKIFSELVSELNEYRKVVKETPSVVIEGDHELVSSEAIDLSKMMLEFEIQPDVSGVLSWELTNEKGEVLKMGFNASEEHFFIDRSGSGLVDFSEKFAANVSTAPFTSPELIEVQVVVDKMSVELFVNCGEVVMTEIFFPTEPYSKLTFTSPSQPAELLNVLVSKLENK